MITILIAIYLLGSITALLLCHLAAGEGASPRPLPSIGMFLFWPAFPFVMAVLVIRNLVSRK